MTEEMEEAQFMSTSKCLIPEYLRNNPGDCLGIIKLAKRIKLDAYMVAQNSYFIDYTAKSGQKIQKVGYTTQLIMGAVRASGLLEGTLQLEYKAGSKKIARAYGRLKGSEDVLYGSFFDCEKIKTQSSLWQTHFEQQLYYAVVKQWCRKYLPEVIMGMYTAEEIKDFDVEKKSKPKSKIVIKKTMDEHVDDFAGLSFEEDVNASCTNH